MADLFDGLFADLPPAAVQPKKEEEKEEHKLQGKRPAPSTRTSTSGHDDDPPESSSSTSKKPRAASDKEDKGKATQSETVDLREALQKVTKALISTKPEKALKAMELLLKLLSSEMNAENAPQFHASLAFFMASEGAWDRLLEERAQASRLCAVLKEHILIFPPEQQFAAATWILVGQLRADLLTDDTFEFRRAARQIKEYITALQSHENNDTHADQERRKAVLACLATALKQNLHQWAKPSIEDLFKCATEKRLFFPDVEREELDEMATKLRTTARGLSVNPGGGTIVGRSVRMVNSMATPFNTKKGDIYR